MFIVSSTALPDYLHFLIAINSQAFHLQLSETPVNNAIPHHIRVALNYTVVTVTLDEHTSKHFTLSSSDTHRLGTVVVVNLGGTGTADRRASVSPHVIDVGYIGCIHDVTLGGERINLIALTLEQDADDVTDRCERAEPQCPNHPCHHGGLCVDGWTRFVCQCAMTGYTGTTCNYGT